MAQEWYKYFPDAYHKSQSNRLSLAIELSISTNPNITSLSRPIMKLSAAITALLASSRHAWMPQDRDLEAFNRSLSLDKRSPGLPSYKIRGVNLGGWLISEPWMMPTEWSSMSCGSACSEFDCVSALGQSQADTNFNAHYASWITPSMIEDIHNAGLNTIRIPIGYWSMRSLVDSSEHFPEMDLQYLDAVIQKAADLGMFVVMDLHGAPGAQKVEDAFTGQVSFVQSCGSI
jgi:hypothetical protein